MKCERPAYDEAAVKASQNKATRTFRLSRSRSMSINHEKKTDNADVSISSQLSQWPVQIKLVPVNAPYFDGANLLVAADCSAYAYGNFTTISSKQDYLNRLPEA